MSQQTRRGDEERLRDIADAAAAIRGHIRELEIGSAPEQVVIDAVKYNLVAIGEAVAHVSEELRGEYPEVDWVAIKGLRNILTHEYFRVNYKLVRQIAEAHVPVLAGQIAEILEAH